MSGKEKRLKEQLLNLGETNSYEFVLSHLVKGDKSFFEEKQAFVSQKRSSFFMKPIFLSTLSDKISLAAESFVHPNILSAGYFVHRNILPAVILSNIMFSKDFVFMVFSTMMIYSRVD